MTTAELTERRELAHRTNDGIDVTLFWSKASNRVTISVFHARSATALEFEVDGADALDAFNHPYAYAATSGARHIATPPRGDEPVSVATDT
jgi:hypothetical protein